MEFYIISTGNKKLYFTKYCNKGLLSFKFKGFLNSFFTISNNNGCLIQNLWFFFNYTSYNQNNCHFLNRLESVTAYLHSLLSK